MEKLLNSINWWEFLGTALVLTIIYLVLFVIQKMTGLSSFSGRYQLRIRNIFRQIFVVYELAAIVILAGVFVMVHPILHGLILLFLVFTSLPYLRSYISGRWICFDNAISEGVELKTTGLQGVVLKMGRIKMNLQTHEGLHHLSYNNLLTDGYTLVSGEEIGGFYRLGLSPKETIKNIKNHRLHLLDLFATAPYVDWHHKPEIFRDETEQGLIDARVLIKEESHLHELIDLIKEWGYQCKMLD